MTTSLFLGHLQRIPAFQAQRTLAMMDALHPTEASVDRLLAAARGDEDASEPQPSPDDAGVLPFRLKVRDPLGHGNFDGWVSTRALKERVTTVMSS